MASKIGDSGVEFSRLAVRPANPPTGLVFFNTERGYLEVYDGADWRPVSQERDFLNRQIITTSFVMGGYVSSSPWKNVNTMVHATDVCTNNGDVIPYAQAYTSGACSLTVGYLWGADDLWPGTSTQTSAFNMYTYTGITGNNMRNARNDSGTVNKEHDYAWIVGGGPTDVDVINLSTDTMMGAQGITATAGDTATQGSVGCHSDENAAMIWTATDVGQKFTFATGTPIATVTSAGAAGYHGQQKGISSKVGKGYGGNEGSYQGGYLYRRWSYATDTNIGNVSKPYGDSGEENYDMGQTHQYMLGMYNGAQNNLGHKFTYATDSGITLGAGSVRTGVPGGSSGACAWRD